MYADASCLEPLEDGDPRLRKLLVPDELSESIEETMGKKVVGKVAFFPDNGFWEFKQCQCKVKLVQGVCKNKKCIKKKVSFF